ncbi:hypothetical protein [Abyssogena phaseoliformis symbiont]|uniref:hypothetical protein n=1 Tax=Abyssogena phaseoliformis symbiont TaxID=596095 RepID=UPI0019155213|nr:hypothetical protein [Abyssogena phaseoliformis symbiont]
MDDNLQKLIVDCATMGKFNKHQKESGLLDLWDHDIELVKKQETTLEEAESILPRRNSNIGYDI